MLTGKSRSRAGRVTLLTQFGGSNIHAFIPSDNAINTAQRFPAFVRPILILLARIVMYHPSQGAGTPVLAATSPEALKNPEKYKGAYMVPMGKFGKTSKTAANAALAQELWSTTETLLKEMGI